MHTTSATDALGEGSQQLSPLLLGLMLPLHLSTETSCDVLLGGSHPPPEAGMPCAFAGKVPSYSKSEPGRSCDV